MKNNSIGSAHVASLLVILFLLLTIPLAAYLLTKPPGSQQLQNRAQETQTTTEQFSKLEEHTFSQAITDGIIQKPGQILEVNLSYNQNHVSKINSISRKNGYPLTFLENDQLLQLKLTDKNNNSVYETSFKIPDKIIVEKGNGSNSSPSGPINKDQGDFTITIPSYPEASQLKVSDHGTLIDSKDIKSVPEINNSPKFQTITAAKPQQSLNHRLIRPAHATPVGDGFLDITFIGDNYLTANDLTTFHTDVNRAISYLLTIEPFKSRSSQIRFHYIDNTSDLQCNNNYGYLICNNSLIISTLNTAGVPYDKVYVFFNGSGTADAEVGGIFAFGPNGTGSEKEFSHELGHSLGGLYDEYTYLSAGNGFINNSLYANCYAGSPPVTSWQSLSGRRDYAPGCTYTNWYRSSISSIMLDYSNHFFNQASIIIINGQIDGYSGPFTWTDTSAPTISITSPTNNSNAYGNANISLKAADNNRVERVQLWVDGVFDLTDYGYGSQNFNSLYFQSASVPDGKHTLQLRAIDAAGNIGYSPIISVTVNNNGNHPPVASFAYTKSNFTVYFTNKSTDPDNDPLTYSWNFGDGSATSTQVSPSHAYPPLSILKTYTVTLTANDGRGGTSTSTQSVSVP